MMISSYEKSEPEAKSDRLEKMNRGTKVKRHFAPEQRG
jgi:hypothetical protein